MDFAFLRRDRESLRISSGITAEAPQRRPNIEALERRALLSVDASSLAPSPMSSATPLNPAAMTIHISRSEFIFHDNKVVLSLAVHGPPGSSGPMTMTVSPQKGSSEHILSEKYVPSGKVMVVRVGPGNYVVQAEMPKATGPLQMTMSLVGDVQGDGKVTASDLRSMRLQKSLAWVSRATRSTPRICRWPAPTWES